PARDHAAPCRVLSRPEIHEYRGSPRPCLAWCSHPGHPPLSPGGPLMGQKVHPGGLRVGVIHDWKSNWMVSSKEFAGALLEDIKIREHIVKKLAHAGLSDILIRKDKQRITIDIYTARPGIVIGKSGVEVDALRKEVHALTHKNVHININEIKRPELDAKLVAQSIAEQLQNRVSFRRAMKRSLASAIRSGAAGVKVQCSGRLGGSEMSRSEQYSEGRVPLHTIRADIDYGFTEARTPTGRIGVKVWINKGEIMPAGYGGVPGGGAETRLGDQDTARRRGGVSEGLGASREAGRGRGQDREGLGPVRRSRPGQRGGKPGGQRREREQAQAPEAGEQASTDAPVEERGPAAGEAPAVETPPADVGTPAVEKPAPKRRRSRKTEQPAAVEARPVAEEAAAVEEPAVEEPPAPAEPEAAAPAETEEDTGYETVVSTAVTPPEEPAAEPAEADAESEEDA